MQYVNSPFLQLLRVAMPCTERANVPNSQAIWGKARQYQFFAHYTSDIQESEQRNMLGTPAQKKRVLNRGWVGVKT